MNRLALSVLAATAAAGLLAGCNSKEPGNATGAPETGGNTQSNTPTSAPGGDEAPPVTGPEISLDKFKSAPCTLVPAEQLSKIGDLREGRPADRQGQPQCSWEPKASTGGVAFTLTISKSTLSDYYKGKSNYNYFKPTEISGYPSANFDGTEGKNGHCGTAIALGKDSTLVVQITVRGKESPSYTTPCVESERISTVAIDGLK
ncbi:DUF3558 domain-containing protein [Lentzea tibetensis]|uniref:DUF3558 domain-containing protein n=1 Tax=Lentzea tibetensis TaxID=2591470 RepID=A0A563EXS0_9PSEU|nr:DUF3558 domain-containing protein [Lentzea tibetensis]TWP52459.1 DUF3558 domain-containing protein [Lentzea tibetensis]